MTKPIARQIRVREPSGLAEQLYEALLDVVERKGQIVLLSSAV